MSAYQKRENSLKFTDSIYLQKNSVAYETIFGDINFITKAFYSVLYVFSYQSQSKLYELTGKILQHATTIILTYLVLGDLYIIYVFFYRVPMGLTFSSLVTDFCSFSVRIILLYKKTTIMLAMKFIQESYVSLLKKNIRRRRVKLSIAFIACFIIPSIEYVYVVMSCCEIDDFYFQSLFFGLIPENYEVARIAVLIINTITVNQHFALPGFAVVLCCYIFGVLRRFVDKFSAELKKQKDIQNIMKIYINYSGNIYVCVEKIEDAFSGLLVLLYGYMTCSIFNATTLLVKMDFRKIGVIDIMPNFVIIVTVLPAFFIMSLRATAINDAAIKVKQTIYESVARIDSSDHKQRNLLLAMAEDFPDRVVVTGWGLFTIKRNFIQGTAGVMLTYGILLSQLK